MTGPRGHRKFGGLRRAVAVFAISVIGCGSPESPPQGTFDDPSLPLSRIRYTDRDLVSLNESCPVTGTRLSPAIPPVYVNGQPIGFC